MKLLAVLATLLGSAHAQCSWSLNTEKGHNEIWFTGSDGDAKVRFIQVKKYGRVRNVSHYIIQGSFLGTIWLCSLRWDW